MQRRSFLKKAGFGIAATSGATLAAPVFAQDALHLTGASLLVSLQVLTLSITGV